VELELELLEFTLELELERNFLLRSQVELELGTFSEGGTLGTLTVATFLMSNGIWDRFFGFFRSPISVFP
jgi:hypothetical protein